MVNFFLLFVIHLMSYGQRTTHLHITSTQHKHTLWKRTDDENVVERVHSVDLRQQLVHNRIRHTGTCNMRENKELRHIQFTQRNQGAWLY